MSKPKLFLILLERPQVFTEAQLKVFVDIFVNIGTLFFGSTVVPFFVPGLDRPKPEVLILGLVVSCLCWLIAILFARKIKS